MSDDLEEIEVDGVPRKMGRTLPTDTHLKMRAGMTSFRSYMESKGIDIDKEFPRSAWKPTNRTFLKDPMYRNDQWRQGACCGFSDAQGVHCLRVLAGMSFKRLSGAYVYDQINGGRDGGACITDCIAVNADGIPPEEDYSMHSVFNQRNQPESRSRFKTQLDLTVTTFFEMAVAMQMGAVIQCPTHVDQFAYNNFDGDGCCGFSKGFGNHSVCELDLVYLSRGEWVFLNGGSWGLWGPWGNGCAYHTEKMIMGCAVEDDAYAHIVIETDPNDPNNPPPGGAT